MPRSERNRLSLRVPLRKEEPAYALLGRLALRYGHVSLRSFTACMGLRRNHRYGSETLTVVAELSGIDLTDLARWSPISCSPHNFQYQGTVFNGYKWIPERRRLCPLCIQEDLGVSRETRRPWMCHRRFWWDLSGIDVCPTHRTWLIDGCPDCKAGFESDYTTLQT